jgi:hypothetical protein
LAEFALAGGFPQAAPPLTNTAPTRGRKWTAVAAVGFIPTVDGGGCDRV